MGSKKHIEVNQMSIFPGIKNEQMYRNLTKSQSIQFGTHHTKKGPGRYPVKAKQDR